MDEADVWSAAQLIMVMHGDRAAAEAAKLAEKAERDGWHDAVVLWRWIEHIIEQTQQGIDRSRFH
jgi:hypothetical protein